MSNSVVVPKILIIRQARETDEHLGKLLAEKNCQVEEADSLDKGMRRIEASSFDAVVLDLDPASDNDYFFRFMGEHDDSPLLILIDDSSHRWINEKRLGHRIYDYLTRPVSDLDLSKIVQDLIDRRLLMEENRLLKERLKILEKHTDQLFAELEDKVMKNTREIAEKKMVLQKIFNQMDGEIILADKNYRIIQASNNTSSNHDSKLQREAAARIIAEKHPGIIDTSGNLEGVPGRQAVKTGRAVSREMAVVEEKDRLRIIRQTAFPVFDSRVEESWGFVQFTQDITEERIERDRRVQLEKVIVAEKLVTLFSSHLQTLSEAAHHTIDKFKKKFRPNDSDLTNFFKLLDHQATRFQDYLADLFCILNKEPDNTVLVNVNDLLRTSLSQNKLTTISENIKIILALARDVPPVKVNRSQLTRVFTHFIDNALDSMPAGGELKIATRNKDSKVEIQFSDTGTGIPEEIRGKIFEPFFTTKAKRLGLGLSVCKFVLEKHNGRIILHCDQTAGKTTTFIISIPSSLDCQSWKG